MKSHFQYKEDEVIVNLPSSRDSIPRRICIKKDDVSDSNCGPSVGCRGCEATNRGLVGIYRESCRARIEKEITITEPKRFDRVNQVLANLASHEECFPGDSAGGGGEEEEPHPVFERARLRLEKSQQAVGDTGTPATGSSGSGITEEKRSTALQEKRDQEMKMNLEAIQRKRERRRRRNELQSE